MPGRRLGRRKREELRTCTQISSCQAFHKAAQSCSPTARGLASAQRSSLPARSFRPSWELKTPPPLVILVSSQVHCSATQGWARHSQSWHHQECEVLWVVTVSCAIRHCHARPRQPPRPLHSRAHLRLEVKARPLSLACPAVTFACVRFHHYQLGQLQSFDPLSPSQRALWATGFHERAGQAQVPLPQQPQR